MCVCVCVCVCELSHLIKSTVFQFDVDCQERCFSPPSADSRHVFQLFIYLDI